MGKKDAVTLIETDPPLAGFQHFIGAWLCREKESIIVDVGTATAGPGLVKALAGMGVEHIDYVLLTHIHIDHAGGLSSLLKRYPMAKVVCHEKAVDHLTNPSKLWTASQQTLGRIAEAYGPPGPIGKDRLISHTQARVPDLEIIETPGHASHHLAYSWHGNLFAGEAAGNYYASDHWEYLRPATPPRFHRDLFLASLDKLAALPDQSIYYAHLGKAPSSRDMLRRFWTQIWRWNDLVQREREGKPQNRVARCVEILLESDPELRAFSTMAPDVQERERYFISNSIKGFIGFLDN